MEGNGHRNSFDQVYEGPGRLTVSEEDVGNRGSSIEERLPPEQEDILRNLKEELKNKGDDKTERRAPQVEPPSDIVIKKYSLPCFEIQEQDGEDSTETNRDSVIDTAPPQPMHALLSPRRPSARRTRSKSRSQLPPSPTRDCQSQRRELASMISEACEHLCKGIMLNKYCYGCFKIEPAVLCFSEDLAFMALSLPENEETHYYSMGDFVDCWRGLESRRFREYLDEGYSPTEDHCFSLVFEGRSFDFSADDASTAHKTIDHLKFLRACQ